LRGTWPHWAKANEQPLNVSAISIFAPAKLNLFLAVTGRRMDGFHELVSLVAPLDFGDTLQAEPAGKYSLSCDDPELAVDETNLVLKAAREFAAAVPRAGEAGARFALNKRVPVGAGLGGGSSDAVAALRLLHRLHGQPIPEKTLAGLAARLGSDCPLFLHDGPVIIRGRGERVERLPPAAASRLRGRRVLIFKPAFPVATAWAYHRLTTVAGESPMGDIPGINAAAYFPAEAAEARLAAWLGDAAAPLASLLFNSLERPVFSKFLALPELLKELHDAFGLQARLSGSGSACFVLLEENTPAGAVADRIRRAWGGSAFVVEARLA